jgi:hypothetical protein
MAILTKITDKSGVEHESAYLRCVIASIAKETVVVKPASFEYDDNGEIVGGEGEEAKKALVVKYFVNAFHSKETTDKAPVNFEHRGAFEYKGGDILAESYEDLKKTFTDSVDA